MKLLSDDFTISVPRPQLVRALFFGGYYRGEFNSLEEAIDNASLRRTWHAIREYQHFNGLLTDGQIGPITIRSMQAPRLCQHPDIMSLEVVSELSGPRFPQPDINWALVNNWPRVSMAQIKQAFEWAFLQWTKVCNIRFHYVTDANQAHIRITSGPIDHQGGTLAWSELANGTMAPRQQKYDSLERWVFSESPPQFTIDLGRTAEHEIGHAIGIPHISAGNLMQPSYDLRIRTPQRGDIQEAVRRYGEPVDVPPNGGEPDRKFLITITGDGNITGIQATGYRVTPLLVA